MDLLDKITALNELKVIARKLRVPKWSACTQVGQLRDLIKQHVKERAEEASFERIIDANVNNPKAIEDKITRYTDLLRYNIAFLNGRLPRTFYYTDKWGTGTGDDHARTSTQNLIELHRYGVFTHNGQNDECEPEVRQRSYIEFAIPVTFANDLAKYCCTHDITGTLLILYPNKRQILFSEPFDDPILHLTDELTGGKWKMFSTVGLGDFWLLERVPKGLKIPLANAMYVVPDFCKGLAEVELLNIVKEMNVPILVD